MLRPLWPGLFQQEELTRYGIGPCAHLSIRMHRPVMKINQQMVFGTKRRNMLRPAVLFLHISSHETVFYTGSAPRAYCAKVSSMG